MDTSRQNTLDGAARLARLDSAGRHVVFTGGRTANSFSDTAVSDDELKEIWELARWAPTSANTQPLRVLYVCPGEGRERLAKYMSDGNRGKTESAPAVAVLARDTDFHEHIPALLPYKPELKDVFAANEELRTTTGTFNAALQAGYFILAVRAMGLAAGPMIGFDADGVDAEFFPDGRCRSILVVNIGHPAKDAWFDRLPRLGNEDALQWV